MKNHLGHLPCELITKILYYIQDKTDWYACTLVNKNFYYSIRPLLWSKPTIDSASTLSKLTTTLANSSKLGEHVRTVRINFNLHSSALLTLIPHVPFLTHLHLDNIMHHITDTYFRCVPLGCPHLTTLSLCSVGITLTSLLAIGKRCRHLHTISLRSCPHLPDDPYQLFANALRDCPLTSIDLLPKHYAALPNPHSMTTAMNNHRDFAEALALVLAKTHPMIESLTLWNPYLDKTRFITISNTEHLVWTQLTHLEIDGAYDLDDAQIIRFLGRHPKLNHFSVGYTKITDRTLHVLPTLLPNMKRIYLESNTGITAAGLCDLVKRYGRQLEDVVRCDGCSIYTTDADFPHDDLDPASYGVFESYMEDEPDELIWLAGHAFDNKNIK